MNSKKTIILDLDSVVFDIAEPMRKAFLKHTGKDRPVDQWHCFSIATVYQEPIDDLLDIMIEERVLEEVQPYAYAKKSIDTLRDLGFYVIACTNRSFHPHARIVTEWSLSRSDIFVDRVVINSPSQCKTLACLAETGINRFDYLVDDHCSNTKKALDSGLTKTAVLISQPWNTYSNPLYFSSRADSLESFTEGLVRES